MSTVTPATPTPADLRALAAARRVSWYIVAAALPVHPSRLSQLINERLPMSADLAVRIQRAIEAVAK